MARVPHARLGLFLVAAAIVCYYAIYFVAIRNTRSNFLYEGSLDLRHHRVSEGAPSGRVVVLCLGGSPVSGNNIPPETTISDQLNRGMQGKVSYNLGANGAGVVESMVYLLLAVEHVKPEVVIYGANPHSFPPVASSLVASYHIEKLRPYLPPEYVRAMEKDWALKADLTLRAAAPMRIPTPWQLALFTWFYDARHAVYGPLFSKSVAGRNRSIEDLERNRTLPLLDVLRRIVEERGARFWVYLEPLYKPDDIFGRTSFAAYHAGITQFLLTRGIRYRDYTHEVPEDHQHFIDFVHLTPLGNAIVASRLLRDLPDLGR